MDSRGHAHASLSIRHFGAVVAWVALIAVLVGSAGVVAASVVFEPHVERVTSGQLPDLFYDDASVSSDVGPISAATVFAHNTGDDPDALRLALEHGANAVEIDVVEVSGVLYAAHDRPPSALGNLFLRSPRLDNIWVQIPATTTVMLDLKQGSSRFVQAVGEFLDGVDRPNVVIASRSLQVLRDLRASAPNAEFALSIGSQGDLELVFDGSQSLAGIDGVTIRHSLLDATTIDNLSDLGLGVIAWTVNDVDRANELLALGATAVTTDNLAIIERTAV